MLTEVQMQRFCERHTKDGIGLNPLSFTGDELKLEVIITAESPFLMGLMGTIVANNKAIYYTTHVPNHAFILHQILPIIDELRLNILDSI